MQYNLVVHWGGNMSLIHLSRIKHYQDNYSKKTTNWCVVSDLQTTWWSLEMYNKTPVIINTRNSLPDSNRRQDVQLTTLYYKCFLQTFTSTCYATNVTQSKANKISDFNTLNYNTSRRNNAWAWKFIPDVRKHIFSEVSAAYGSVFLGIFCNQ